MTKLFKISLDVRFTWIVRGPTPTISIVSYGSPDLANLQETPLIILYAAQMNRSLNQFAP